jgi:hypothetical protein
LVEKPAAGTGGSSPYFVTSSSICSDFTVAMPERYSVKRLIGGPERLTLQDGNGEKTHQADR